MAKAGDKVKLVTKDKPIEGVLMPDEDDFYMIKLDSGYNVGVDKKRVKEVKVLEEYKEPRAEPKEVSQKKNLPTISVLHTGGTIASKVDYETGGVIARYTPEELLDMFPELKEIANVRSRLVRNMWSEDIRFAHYNILAKEIEKELSHKVDGIIITHGTDLMHCTSAALSFMLQNLPVPVILVGAQRSSDRGSSDAAINLLSAAYFMVAHKEFADVAICMHESMNDDWCVILPGTKTRKMHSSRRDAFQAINAGPWARVHFKEKTIQMLGTGYKTNPVGPLQLKLMKEDLKVGLLKVHPTMYAEEFEWYKGFDGLVIEGTGIAGNMPINEIDEFTKEHTKIASAIKNLVDSGTVVAAATQTISGGVNMNVYATGRKMQELGIIGDYTDITPETAFIKLAWLLSNYPKDKVKELFGSNIAGEMSDRLDTNSRPVK